MGSEADVSSLVITGAENFLAAENFPGAENFSATENFSAAENFSGGDIPLLVDAIATIWT